MEFFKYVVTCMLKCLGAAFGVGSVRPWQDFLIGLVALGLLIVLLTVMVNTSIKISKRKKKKKESNEEKNRKFLDDDTILKR